MTAIAVKMRFNVEENNEIKRGKKRTARPFKIENEANRYPRVYDSLRRSLVYALHGEIEIANNSATEQYAPLTLICIKGVRIVSISNAVYT